MSDQQIRDLFHETVADVTPTGPGWEDVERRALAAEGADRRRRLVGAVVGIAAAVAVVLAGAAVLQDDDGTKVKNDEVPPAGVETTVTSLAPKSVAPMPSTFVATRDGSTELVLASSSDGRVVRVLADTGKEIIYSVELSPDGVWAYFSTGPEPVVGALRRVRVAGGPVEELGAGKNPALSPDNRTLAYVLDDAVVFRDLASGRERSYRQPGVVGFGSVAWTKGSDALVVQAISESSTSWFVVGASLIDEPRRLQPQDRQRIWTDVSMRPSDGRIAFVETCCVTPPRASQQAEVALVDPATGRTTDRVALAGSVLHVEFDQSGEHVLYVDKDGKLSRRQGGSEVRLGSFSLADW